MFGNALLFLSNTYFNECFRVDAAYSFEVEKFNGLSCVKTVQGYLFNDDNSPCYEFCDDETEHESLQLLNDRSFFINLDNGSYPVLIEFDDVNKMDSVRELLKVMQGHKTTHNLMSIFTIYFD